MSAQSEADLVREMHDAFDAQLDDSSVGYWRKIHGELYQAGMPDVLCALDDRAALTEFKFIKDARRAKMPLSDLVKDVTTARQSIDLTICGAVDGPLRSRIVVGMPVEFELHGAPMSGTLAIGVDWIYARAITQSLLNLASIAVAARGTSFKDAQPRPDPWRAWPPRVEGQLRLRAEAWRAAPIVLGVEAWVPKEIKHAGGILS